MKTCTLAGIGMSIDTVTQELASAISCADLVFGAKRVVDSVKPLINCPFYYEYEGKNIISIINEKSNEDKEKIVVLFSGDTGFYSGQQKVFFDMEKQGFDVKVLCGISSVQYFASKLNKSWQDWYLVSAHGTDCNLGQCLSHHRKVFFLTGGKTKACDIVDFLCENDCNEAFISAGVNLGMQDSELIIQGNCFALKNRPELKNDLCVVLVELPFIDYRRGGAIKDDLFIRSSPGQKVIPMTKQMVRAGIIALLSPKNGEIVWDIGCGTGSVSIDLSLCADCSVYAVEIEKAAYELEKLNKKKFNALNVNLNLGNAVDVINGFPSPDCVFIGGSKGDIRQIIDIIRNKNQKARIVVSCVTVETLCQVQAVFDEYYGDYNVNQMQISVGKRTGEYHLMTAQNPVWLLSV